MRLKDKKLIMYLAVTVVVVIALITSLGIGRSSKFLIRHIEEYEITNFRLTKSINDKVVMDKELNYREGQELIAYMKDLRFAKILTEEVKYESKETYCISGKNSEDVEYLLIECKGIDYFRILWDYNLVYFKINDYNWIDYLNNLLE